MVRAGAEPGVEGQVGTEGIHARGGQNGGGIGFGACGKRKKNGSEKRKQLAKLPGSENHAARYPPPRMDQELLFFINRTAIHPVTDWILAILSSFDFWWPFFLLGGILGAVFGGFRFRAFLVVAGLAVGVNDGIVVHTLKDVVGRPRPNEMLEGVRSLDLAPTTPRFLALGKPLKVSYSEARIQPPHGKSFPSGHTSNVFALATVAAVFYRRRGWLAYFPAALVGYSRIAVGSHWPTDVVISSFLGTGVALIVCASLAVLWRRLAARWTPALYERHPDLLGP